MALQDSSAVRVQARIDAGVELFQSCITSAKEMLEISFGKPTSYYDGEKKNILQIAHSIFETCVKSEDVDKLVAEDGSVPDIEVGSMGFDDDGPSSGEEASTCTGNVSGF